MHTAFPTGLGYSSAQHLIKVYQGHHLGIIQGMGFVYLGSTHTHLYKCRSRYIVDPQLFRPALNNPVEPRQHHYILNISQCAKNTQFWRFVQKQLISVEIWTFSTIIFLFLPLLLLTSVWLLLLTPATHVMGQNLCTLFSSHMASNQSQVSPLSME